VILLVAGLGGPGVARAAAPPDPHDPCASAGRDSCSTTGVGRYATYQYGLRWFGDYRGAVRGVSGATFCIDLDFWYPGRSYHYQRQSAAHLVNRAGVGVPARNLHRMAFALWRYGRSSGPNEQGATMLYVHGLMGDAAPGELPPGVLGPAVHSLYERIAADAARYAGPYTIDAKLPQRATAGTPTTLKLDVRAASGALVPDVRFDLAVTGSPGAPGQVSSGVSGTATVSLTPDDAGGKLHVRATAPGLPSTLPRLYAPTRGAAVGSGQRLVAPASQAVTADADATVALAKLTVTTAATPSTMTLGSLSSDRVTFAGAPIGFQARVQVSLYGPATTAAGVSCAGTPAATTSYLAGGGDSRTPAVTPTAPGYYGYQLTIPRTADVAADTTACGGGSETVMVVAAPQVHTTVSAGTLQPGGELSDTVIVSGLGGEQATVAANLYGPYPSPAAITCQGAPYWAGTITAQGGGQYVTPAVPLTVPGYYVYQETIASGTFVQATSTPCSDTAETTIVQGVPAVTTQTSSATAAPGAQLSDDVVVTGLGALSATVNVQLWGPYTTKAAINCRGRAAWTGSVLATGNGTYTTDKVTLPSAGYYTYQESIAATSAYAAAATGCGDTSETTFAHASPTLATTASRAVVRSGSSLSDRIKVAGLGTTPVTIKVALFGPYASISAISCSDGPVSQGSVRVNGDGIVSSPQMKVPRAGFYVFRERIATSPLVAGVRTACSITPETTLGAPAIITGPGGLLFHGPAARAGRPAASVPAQIQIPSLGVDAPVQPSAIDLALGQLAVPADIHRAGWWKDGAAPGDPAGTILIAGHVDSAQAGAGAFFPLKSAVRRGMLITVTTRSGRTYRYRVTSIRTVPKPQLPIGIFTRTGTPKLVLVTCGGPFDPQIGHYLDNVVVTASPT